MRCHICDNTLDPTEIKYNSKHKEFDPCGSCKDAIAHVFTDTIDYDDDRLVELYEQEINTEDFSDVD